MTEKERQELLSRRQYRHDSGVERFVYVEEPATAEETTFPWGEFGVDDQDYTPAAPTFGAAKGAPVFAGTTSWDTELETAAWGDAAEAGAEDAPWQLLDAEDVTPTTWDVEEDTATDIDEPADAIGVPASERAADEPTVEKVSVFGRLLASVRKVFGRPAPAELPVAPSEQVKPADAESAASDDWDDEPTQATDSWDQEPELSPAADNWETESAPADSWATATATEDEAPVGPKTLTKAERREQKKADAEERKRLALDEKARRADEKRSAKSGSVSDEKRQAIAEKEQKQREKKRLAEAEQEQKLEDDEVKARARREKKATQDWKRKQKRRDAIRRNGGKEGFWQGTSKPKPIEIANAIRSLAIILEVNPAEIDAVKMMAEEFAGNQIGDAFDRIFDRLVKDNMTLVQAFAPEEVFPAVVHNMLLVGAKTAKPGPALKTAVEIMDAGNGNARKMRNALIEPLILAVLSLVTLFITAWFVVPVFVTMYDDLKLEIGLFTRFVLIFSDISIWTIGIGAIAGALIAIWWFIHGRGSLRVRIAIDRWKLGAPLMGKGEQSGEAFQMFNIIDSYLAVGATERETLLGAASAVTNRAIKRHLRAIANGLTRGEKTFAQLLDDDMFPRLARSILATGQRTGQTMQAIKNLRRVYENEARIEGEQAVQKVVGLVSSISTVLFMITGIIVSLPPIEIFGATLSYKG